VFREDRLGGTFVGKAIVGRRGDVVEANFAAWLDFSFMVASTPEKRETTAGCRRLI